MGCLRLQMLCRMQGKCGERRAELVEEMVSEKVKNFLKRHRQLASGCRKKAKGM